MERDFEQEFRALKQSEIPDLWNRIEAGISEREIKVPVERAAGKHYAWRKWGTAAAACLCLAVVFPALVLFVGKQNRSESDNMSAEAPDGGEPMYEEADLNDMAVGDGIQASETEKIAESAGAYENADQEMAAESAPDMERSEGSGASASLTQESAADTAEDESSASADRTDALIGNGSSQKDESGAASAQEDTAAAEVALPLEEGYTLEDVTVQIESSRLSGESVFYQVTVQKSDKDVILEAGMQTVVVCDSGTEYDFMVGPREQKALKENGNYKVTLCYEQNRLFVRTASKE